LTGSDGAGVSGGSGVGGVCVSMRRAALVDAFIIDLREFAHAM
jgi:hypothetical protein